MAMDSRVLSMSVIAGIVLVFCMRIVWICWLSVGSSLRMSALFGSLRGLKVRWGRSVMLMLVVIRLRIVIEPLAVRVTCGAILRVLYVVRRRLWYSV